MSESDDALQDAKLSSEIVGELIRTAGDSDEGRKAAQNIGKTAVTITSAINNALLPITAINYTIDKARAYFTREFPTEMALKAAGIPEDELKQPQIDIAGPAIAALAFSHEDKTVRELFLNLIRSSMDARQKDLTHPAFVEIAKQLSGKDALALALIYKNNPPIATVQINHSKKDGSAFVVRNHFTKLGLSNNDSQSIGAVTIENLLRLQLIDGNYASYVVEETAYDWVLNHPEYILRLQAGTGNPDYEVNFKKGVILSTSFGQQFANVVDLSSVI